jgi:predicted enzyme related to lactoylglutathione lyase/predicted glycoside hydrolase/deacetylase ChbG (UPF0249 family)
MSNVVHFSIYADDIVRAKTFYENVFGWQINELQKDELFLIFPSNKSDKDSIITQNTLKSSFGIGLIQKRINENRFAAMINVSNIEETRKKIDKNGGKLLTPIIPIQGVGFFSTFQDTEGNVFNIIKEDHYANVLLWKEYSDIEEGKKSLVEQLGFSKDSILVIVHADDIGMHPKQTDGALKAIKYGLCKTGSVMVPCPDAERVLKIWKDNPDLDLGIHLTLNSEWGTYRWKPLLSKDEVPSLYDPDGYMWQFGHELQQNLNVNEAIKELEAQIQAVLDIGLKPTHLDSHMGCYYLHPDLGKGVELLAKKYNLPLIPYSIETARSKGYVFPNTFWQFTSIIGESWNPNLRKEKYHSWLKNLKPGVHEVVTHISLMSDELEKILEPATDQSQARLSDYYVWTSSDTKKLAEKLGIIFIGFKELHKLQTKLWQ